MLISMRKIKQVSSILAVFFSFFFFFEESLGVVRIRGVGLI